MNIIIDFNEYLETILAGLEGLETRIKAIGDNLRVKIDELKGTDDIIENMKKNLE